MIFQIYPLGHLLLAIAELFLLGWSIRLWLQTYSLAAIALSVILIGISYDNLLLATGTSIGKGDLLQFLSQIRFLVHHLVVPFLIVVGVELASNMGASWANNLIRNIAWIISLSLGVLDIFNRYQISELKPIYFAGVLRYTASLNGRLPIIAIVVTLFVLLIGIGIWIRSDRKWFWLFLGALVALLGNALPSSQVGTLPSSLSEFFLTLTLLLTERYTQLNRTVLLTRKNPSPIV